MNTVICASGDLGFSTLENISSELNILAVLTDKNSQSIINWAGDNAVPVFTGNPRNGSCSDFLSALDAVEILLSINYLFIIEEDLIGLPSKAALNIHGSLLPKYRGRAPHIWAIINGEEQVGITVHQIDVGCDTGGILIQREIAVTPITTGGDLIEQFRHLYPELLKQAVELVRDDRCVYIEQNEQDSSYFGKRSPEDGLLDWNWNRQRIYNWVRALTNPYPGAFCLWAGRKVYLWKAVLADEKIDNQTCIGQVVKSDNGSLYVKAADGIVKILEYSIEDNGMQSKQTIPVGVILR
ncbi:methionyl-tRNA formyltransferase [Pseudohalioglobus lutimaris]|uniref:Formyl transferase n=1 Tax=Pseudohalioglobus lutimaris TaxID=1737061 RepID=A0A2N5X6Y7_9GAMM|nr:methionyl-tRNA formyltransferase [Pseudohalioglobus lutimaris]PLW70248.1 formyl transferase [Pseudohalioglobus lutimaris]